jgi:hypothetical protein
MKKQTSEKQIRNQPPNPRKQTKFHPSSTKVSILDLDSSLELFSSPKKDIEEEFQSPHRRIFRKTLAQKLKDYGY